MGEVDVTGETTSTRHDGWPGLTEEGGAVAQQSQGGWSLGQGRARVKGDERLDAVSPDHVHR